MKNQRLKKTRQLIQRLPFIIGHEIWQSSVIGERSLRGRLFSLLRVITITYRGLQENNVFGHAAGLSYYSLIGMGPLLAIGIMISSFMVSSKEDDSTIRDALVKLVYFIAPPTLEYSRIEEATVQESDRLTFRLTTWLLYPPTYRYSSDAADRKSGCLPRTSILDYSI